MPAPLSLTDEQMDAVLRAAEPIDPAHRAAFLEDLATELSRCPAEALGSGSIFCAIREVQRRHFDPPSINGGAGLPRWSR